MAVTFNYGSLHNNREREAAREVLKHYTDRGVTIPWIVENVPDGWYAGVSALMGGAEMPEATYEDLEEHEGPSPTVVPFRNAFLISRCTTNAIKYGYEYVAVATHASDHNNWAYPDCSPEFLGAMANAVYIGSYREVRLMYTYAWATKAQLVQKAYEVQAPLHLSYSCYKGEKFHCGVCPTCIERQKAFIEAGFQDNVHYEVAPVKLKEGQPWPVR